MEQFGQELNRFEEIIEKTIDANTKAALKFILISGKPIDTIFMVVGQQQLTSVLRVIQ